MAKLTGKVALITGGSSGIGRATAILFAREGARVVIASRRHKEGQETVKLVAKEGGEAIFVSTDVTRAAEVDALVETTKQRFGRLDIAVNNAGTTGRLGPIIEQDEASWRETIDGNLTSLFLSARYQIPAMVAGGGGSIINVASVVGNTVAFPGTTMYSAAKAGVVGLTKALAVEYAKAGVRVNALVPGGVDTPMFRSTMGATAESAAYIASLHALGRVAQPEELASAALFLASNDSSFVTGSAIIIDGAMSIQ